MLLYMLAIAGGCLGLFLGGDFLLRGAMAIGKSLGWSTAAIGFVLVSLGTSAPELFVSASAALQGYGDMAAGNVVGSNIVNIAIVLGLGAMIVPLAINRSIRVHQMPLMLVLTVMGFAFLVDGYMGRLEGLLLLLAAAASLWWAMHVDGTAELDISLDEPDEKQPGMLSSIAYSIAGIGLLVLGAEGLIWGGVGLAAAFGVPPAVIALTVTSIGTSLPEITATLLAVARKDTDLAVGNVVGSNLLNIGLVLGLAGVLSPINSSDVDLLPLGVMLFLSVSLGIFAWRPGYIGRLMGGGLVTAFAVYAVVLVQ